MVLEIDTKKKTVIFKSPCVVNELYDIIVEYQLQDFKVEFETKQPYLYSGYSNGILCRESTGSVPLTGVAYSTSTNTK